MSRDTSSPVILMLRAARVVTKSFPVFGSTRLLRLDWTCASLRDMRGGKAAKCTQIAARISPFPMRTLFVTTALPYANGPFHIGHIMEYIQADIWVRYQRMQGHELHFVGADDAHGAPIMLKAQEEGVTPQELVARIAADRPRYLKGFHISF